MKQLNNDNLGCQDLKFSTANNIETVTFTTLQNKVFVILQKKKEKHK